MNSKFSVSPTSLAIDYVLNGQTLAKGFRQFVSEFSETDFHATTLEQVAKAIDAFLTDSASVWLKPTRLGIDGDTWSDFGKKIASACVGHPHAGSIVVLCRLRKESSKATAPKADALSSGCLSIVARKAKTEKGKDLYRFVSWELSIPKAKRAADALDIMPFEGSERSDDTNAYPLAAAPSLLGTERPISQDKALKDAVTAAQIETKRARQQTRLDLLALRRDRTVSELKEANLALLAQIEALRFEHAKLVQAMDRASAFASAAAAATSKRTSAKRTPA